MNEDQPKYEKEFRGGEDFKEFVVPESPKFLTHIDGVDLWLCQNKLGGETNVTLVSPRYFGVDLWFWIDVGEHMHDDYFAQLPTEHTVREFVNNFQRLHQ